MSRKAPIEYRIFQGVRCRVLNLLRVGKPSPDWPNRDHPPQHRFWRRVFGHGSLCYYCGLQARP